MKNHAERIKALILISITLMLPLNSALCTEAVRTGLEICLNTIIPSIYPFLFFTSLLFAFCPDFLSNVFSFFVCPLFNISPRAVSAFVVGTFGGFPSGAQCAAMLYKQGKITKKEAERLPIFCNNAGPMFVIGAVGVGYFCSLKAGVMLYLVHLLASVTAGIITRPKEKFPPFTVNSFEKAHIYDLFPKCIVQSVKTMAIICGNFIVFRVLCSLLLRALPAGTFSSLIHGGIELTGGIITLTPSLSGLVSASFILGFNGLCVHMQSASFLLPEGLSLASLIKGKLLCGLLSSAFMFILLSFVSPPSPTFPAGGFLINGVVISFSLALFLLSLLFLALIKLKKAGK